MTSQNWYPGTSTSPARNLSADETPYQGMLTLILKGEVLVRLTSLSLLVRNQMFQDKLGFFFHYQNNLVLTGKNEEVNRN